MSQHILRVTVFLMLAVATSTVSSAEPTPPEVKKLITQLKDAKAGIRSKAASELGMLNAKGVDVTDATDALAHMAGSDPDADAKSVARQVLTAIKIVTSVGKLKDPDDIIRRQAARDLGTLKSQVGSAINVLKKVAESDPDADVRKVAQQSIDVIKDDIEQWGAVTPFFQGLKSKKPADRVEALAQIAKLGEKGQRATNVIVHTMFDSSPAVREAAVSCLEKVDPKLSKHVITVLHDADPNEIAASAEALGKLGARAEGALPALHSRWAAIKADASRTGQQEIDYTSLKAMVSIAPDDPVIVSEVLRLVSIAPNTGGRNRSVVDRSAGLFLLRSVEASNARKVNALIAALKEQDSEIRLVVIGKLAGFEADAKPALPALTQLKLSGDVKTREAVSKAIERIDVAK